VKPLPPLDQPEFIPTRESLLGRLKDWQDAGSWREFFDRYWRLIYSVARKSGLTETEAQEAVQETLITVSKKIPEFKYDPKIGSFKGWLRTITDWRIADQLRKRKKDAAVVRSAAGTATDRTATVDRIPDPASVMEGVWDEEWENNIVQLAIQHVKQEVKPRQYQIFDLYVVKKWPASKVTSTLGVNMGQVYLAKHRVGALIKKQIAKLKEQLI
jgi:RNA polymerase sigma factor (sigma-70 family)